MKTCFKCGIKRDLNLFYKHKEMADGHLNKCKECTKKDVLSYRSLNLERVREYDRNRPNREQRSRSIWLSKNTKKRKEQIAKASKAWAVRYRYKRQAYNLVAHAIKSGKIKKSGCILCGKTAQAHHEDYLKPLDIIWYCVFHHQERHKQIRSEMRKKP